VVEQLSSKQKAFMDMTDIEKALSYAAEHSSDPGLSKHVHIYWLAVLANEIERLTREHGEAIRYRDDEFQLRDALANENQRLRAGLERIAAMDVQGPVISDSPAYIARKALRPEGEKP